MKRFTDLVNDCLPEIKEIFPWDLVDWMASGRELLLVDIREPYEYAAMHIAGSIAVPRGILESACEYGYEETVPQLAAAREQEVVLICRSGNRSALAAYVMQLMGYQKVYSLKTGLRGWNDFEQPLVDAEDREVAIDEADEFFATRLRPDQMPPKD